MLESKVYQEDDDGQDEGGHQDEHGRTLQLLPSGPRHLLSQLRVGLFNVVNELTHLCLQWVPENWKRESGTYG